MTSCHHDIMIRGGQTALLPWVVVDHHPHSPSPSPSPSWELIFQCCCWSIPGPSFPAALRTDWLRQPAGQNVHFLFLNVLGWKINYVNMNLFRAERKSWSSQPETMTCRFLQPGLRILHWGFIGGFWNPKLGMMRKSGTNKIQIHFKSWQTTHISHGSNHLYRIYHHLKQMKVRKWFTFHLFLVSN